MAPGISLPRRSLLIGSAAATAAAAANLHAPPAAAAVRRPLMDGAVWDPVTGRSSTAMAPARVTIHIAVTRSADIYGPGTGPGGSYAHFYNPRSGAPRQHQELNRRAAADYNGSPWSISVEHAGIVGDSMTDSQLNNIARIFAWAVVHCDVPNRIATVDKLTGLAWHRLGIEGNFGAYNPNDRTTWSRAQTGAVWSSSRGKECPTNNFIHQLDEVYRRAQPMITSLR